MKRPTRWGAYAAAVLLAGLTLSVFGALRDYGPESALRRFHQAAIDGSQVDLQRVCEQATDLPIVRNLVDHVAQMGRAGARIRVGVVHRETRPKRYGNEIVNVASEIIEVRYYTNRGVESIFWVLDRGPAGWVVNAEETALFTMKRLGIGRPG